MIDLPKTKKRNKRRPRWGWRRIVRRTLLTAGLAVLLLAGAAFLFRKPLAAEIQTRLDAELVRRNIGATYEVRDFRIWEGLALTDLTLYQTSAAQTPVLTLSEIQVSCNPFRLLQSGALSLSADRATLAILDQGEKFTIPDLDAKIHLGVNRIGIDRLNATFRDLRIEITAELARNALRQARERSRKQDDRSEEEKERDKKDRPGIDMAPLARWLREIPDTPDGQLTAKIDCTYVDADSIPAICGELIADRVRWKDLALDEFRVAIMSDRSESGGLILGIPEATFRMGDGILEATAAFDLETRQLRIDRLKSSVDPRPILLMLPRKANAKKLLEFPPHRIMASGTIDLKAPRNTTLEGTVETFARWEIPLKKFTPLLLEKVRTRFSWSDRSITTSDMSAQVTLGDRALEISGDAVARLGKKGENGEKRKIEHITFHGTTLSEGDRRLTVSGKLSATEKSFTADHLESNLDVIGILTDLRVPLPRREIVKLDGHPEIKLEGHIPWQNFAAARLSGSLRLPGVTTIRIPEKDTATETEAKQPRVAEVSDLQIASLTMEEGLLALNDLRFSVEHKDKGAPLKISANLGLKFAATEPPAPGEKPTPPRLTALDFTSVKAKRGERTADFVGRLDLSARTLKVEKLQSTIDLLAAAADLGFPDPTQGTLRFDIPPAISLSGTLSLGDPGKSILEGSVSAPSGLGVALGSQHHLHLHRFSIPSFGMAEGVLAIPALEAGVDTEETPVSLRARLELHLADPENGTSAHLDLQEMILSRAGRSLSLSADMTLPVTSINVRRLDSDIDLIAALGDFGIADPTGGKFCHHEPPVITGKGVFDLANPSRSRAEGAFGMTAGFSIQIDEENSIDIRDFSGIRFHFGEHGVEIAGWTATLGPEETPTRLTANLGITFPPKAPDASGAAASPAEATLDFKEITLERDGLSVLFSGSLPLASRQLSITRFDSNADIVALLRDLGISDPTQGKVTFASPPTLSLSGDLDLTRFPGKSRLLGALQAPDGLSIPFPGDDGRVATIKSLSTGFQIGDGLIAAPNLTAALCEGTLRLNGVIRPGTTPLAFATGGRITGMRFEHVATLFGADDSRTGLVEGVFSIAGTPELEKIEGVASLRVSEADLLSFKLFRGLHPLISAIRLEDHGGTPEGVTLDATIFLQDGVIQSDDIRLEGEFYAIDSRFRFDVPRDQVTAGGTVATTGATRVVTGIIGKILELEGSGSLNDINWRLKNASGLDSIRNLTGMSVDLVRNTVAGAARPRETLGKAANVARDTIGGAAKWGKRLVQLPFRGKKSEQPQADDPQNAKTSSPEEPPPPPPPLPAPVANPVPSVDPAPAATPVTVPLATPAPAPLAIPIHPATPVATPIQKPPGPGD